jgi:putative ABC transport system permease protein
MFAAIAIGGLAVSLAACLLIGTFIRYELSYDRFFPDADRLYRVVEQGEASGLARTPNGLAAELPERFAAIQRATPVFPYSQGIFRRDDQAIETGPIYRVGPQFFQIFPLPFLHGDPQTALSAPRQAVLTKALAERLFAADNPLGETFIYQRDERRYTVTGVIEEVPPNSHFNAEALLSEIGQPSEGVRWRVFGPFTYVHLAPGADPDQLQTELRRFEASAEPSSLQNRDLTLQPVTDIHLYSDLSGEIGPQSDITYLYIAGLIGLAILLLACMNYATLGASRSLRRAREVGIRKAMGARRRQLAGQFLGESLLVAVLALPLAFGLARLTLPLAPQLIGRVIPSDFLTAPHLLIGGFVLVGIAGLLSGLYPALLGLRMDPARLLPGRGVGAPGDTSALRRGLVTAQFAVSASLIAATLVVWFQLDAIEQRGLGFEPTGLVSLESPSELLGSQRAAFLRQVRNQPAVAQASVGPLPGAGTQFSKLRHTDEATGETWEYARLPVESGYLETVGLELLAGREFRPEEITDSARVVIVSRQAAERFGIAENPIGREIDIAGLKARGGPRQVIGMVGEFHNQSAREPTLPKILVPYSPKYTVALLVRLQSGRVEEGLPQIRKVWEQFLPYRPMSYQFLEDRLRGLYEEDRRLARLLGLSALVALGIACLGLFGLAALAAARRRREIAIRKVLGATVAQVVELISREFLLLTGAGLLIALPLVYFGMHRWLQQFAYQTGIRPRVFLWTIVVVVGIAFLTVSYQSIKAALTNPAESLRYE